MKGIFQAIFNMFLTNVIMTCDNILPPKKYFVANDTTLCNYSIE